MNSNLLHNTILMSLNTKSNLPLHNRRLPQGPLFYRSPEQWFVRTHPHIRDTSRFALAVKKKMMLLVKRYSL